MRKILVGLTVMLASIFGFLGGLPPDQLWAEAEDDGSYEYNVLSGIQPDSAVQLQPSGLDLWLARCVRSHRLGCCTVFQVLG